MKLVRNIIETKDELTPAPKLLFRIRDAIAARYNYTIEASSFLIKFTITSNGVTHDMAIITEEEPEIVSLLMIFRAKTKPERRAEMARLLGQLTFRVIVGGFEMNPCNGECRLRHAVHCEGIDPPNSFFLRMVNTHAATGVQLWPVIDAVMKGCDHNTALRMLPRGRNV
jgi:hypothetical protein